MTKLAVLRRSLGIVGLHPAAVRARDCERGEIGLVAVQTLAERKLARVEEIRAGVDRLRETLAEYGRAHGGKFLLYGSAARGRLHYDSDVDLLVDFAEPDVAAAIDFVESTCARLRLKVDVQPKSWCKQAFIDKIASTIVAIP